MRGCSTGTGAWQPTSLAERGLVFLFHVIIIGDCTSHLHAAYCKALGSSFWRERIRNLMKRHDPDTNPSYTFRLFEGCLYGDWKDLLGLEWRVDCE